MSKLRKWSIAWKQMMNTRYRRSLRFSVLKDDDFLEYVAYVKKRGIIIN